MEREIINEKRKKKTKNFKKKRLNKAKTEAE
jgi:hypothetical protein